MIDYAKMLEAIELSLARAEQQYRALADSGGRAGYLTPFAHSRWARTFFLHQRITRRREREMHRRMTLSLLERHE